MLHLAYSRPLSFKCGNLHRWPLQEAYCSFRCCSGSSFITEILHELRFVQMMGMKAMEAAQHLVKSLKLEGVLTAPDFLAQREAALDAMFPSAQLMPGKPFTRL